MKRQPKLESCLPDRWFATDGVSVLGPLGFDAVARAVAHSEISMLCVVRHAQCNVWLTFEEVQRLSVSEREDHVTAIARRSAAVAPQGAASGPRSAPRERSEVGVRHPSSHPSMRPISVDPAGVMATADDFTDALLLTLSTAAATASAQLGLVLCTGPTSPLVCCTQGRGTDRLLGQALATDDASLAAAYRGAVVVGEPGAGRVEEAISSRLGNVGSKIRGIAMIPLLVDGVLVATLELAHTARPFKAREIARVEDVMEALAARAVVMGWID